VRVRAKDDESFFMTAFLIAAMFYNRGYSTVLGTADIHDQDRLFGLKLAHRNYRDVHFTIAHAEGYAMICSTGKVEKPDVFIFDARRDGTYSFECYRVPKEVLVMIGTIEMQPRPDGRPSAFRQFYEFGGELFNRQDIIDVPTDALDSPYFVVRKAQGKPRRTGRPVDYFLKFAEIQ